MTEEQARTHLKQDVAIAKRWLADIEKREDDDIIPWVAIKSLTEAANAIAYSAGTINALQTNTS